MKRKALFKTLKPTLKNKIGVLLAIYIVLLGGIGAAVGCHLHKPLEEAQIKYYKDIGASIYHNGLENTELPNGVTVELSNNYTVKVKIKIKIYNSDGFIGNKSVTVDCSGKEPDVTSIYNAKLEYGLLGLLMGIVVSPFSILIFALIVEIVKKLHIFLCQIKSQYESELEFLEQEAKKKGKEQWGKEKEEK